MVTGLQPNRLTGLLRHSKVYFQAELFPKIAVAVPYRDFGHTGHIRDLLLGSPLAMHRASDVEGCSCDAGRPFSRYKPFAHRLTDELDRFLLHLSAELQ